MNNSVWEVWIDFGIKVKAISRLSKLGSFPVFDREWCWKPAACPVLEVAGPDWCKLTLQVPFQLCIQWLQLGCLKSASVGIFTPSKLAAAADQSSSLQTWLLDFLPAHHCLYSTPNILPIPLTHTLTHSQQAHRPVCCVCVNIQWITYVHVPLTASLDISNPPCSVILLSLVFFYSLNPDPRQWSLSLTHSLLNSQLFSPSRHETLSVSGIKYRVVKASEAIT